MNSTMKHAILILLACTLAAGGAEYVTLEAGEEKSVDPNSLVEIQGRNSITVFLFRDATQPHTAQYSFQTTTAAVTQLPFLVTGYEKIACNINQPDADGLITLKITSKEELTIVASNVVTLPAEIGQGHVVTLEQSTDLINFTPVSPGEYLGAATPQFFRVKITRQPDPEP